MLNHIWRRCLQQVRSALVGTQNRKPARRNGSFRMRLEELEPRLSPAVVFTVSNTGADSSVVGSLP